MAKRKTILGIPKCGQATSCAPYAPLGCSKSKSATPLTDAVPILAKAYGWEAPSAEMMQLARYFESALSIAVDALDTIAKSDYSVAATEPTAFANVMGAKMALHRIETLNPAIQTRRDD